MGFASDSRERSRPALPLASLVDIIFILLVFFMTISVFREQERQIDVSIPESETALAAASPTQIVITLTETGAIHIGDRAYTLPELRQVLTQLAAQFPDESVVVRGDRASAYGLAVQILDTAYAAGLRNVFLATTRAASEL